ncbi:hypothetical protein TNIN_971 [Trichonephila inaurata madagascariensis]|uniref:Uncharacterized protein n=1 Tax=Trichonephila inaurata madagascariensis TaxID=2747483 RepID=A0A8X6X4A2_9ARAC|nr:hypothetical protein TNIN_971 [Trichonephila inaurata madagascariensis]
MIVPPPIFAIFPVNFMILKNSPLIVLLNRSKDTLSLEYVYTDCKSSSKLVYSIVAAIINATILLVHYLFSYRSHFLWTASTSSLYSIKMSVSFLSAPPLNKVLTFQVPSIMSDFMPGLLTRASPEVFL